MPDSVTDQAFFLTQVMDVTMENGKNHKKNYHRVIALLNRRQVDFLDKIGKDALFATGTKLPRTEIIAAMVNVLCRYGIDVSDVTSVEELEEKIIHSMDKEISNQ